jgi:hypothetical protein
MKIKNNVFIPEKTPNSRENKKVSPTTQILKDFIGGTNENMCLEFDSNEELQRAYGCMRVYHRRHKYNAIDFRVNQESNKLYIIRKETKKKEENKTKILGILFQYGNDDCALWEEFSLTEEEENAIWKILKNHDTEGCSVRGTRKDIAKEMME